MTAYLLTFRNATIESKICVIFKQRHISQKPIKNKRSKCSILAVTLMSPESKIRFFILVLLAISDIGKHNRSMEENAVYSVAKYKRSKWLIPHS